MEGILAVGAIITALGGIWLIAAQRKQAKGDASESVSNAVRNLLDPLNERIDELEALIELLQNRIDKLEQENAALKARIRKLEQENKHLKRENDELKKGKNGIL